MKYTLADYPTGKHILRIGYDTLEINDGVAEVNELDPAQVTLAEIYGGTPAPIKKTVNSQHRRHPFKVRPRALVKVFLEKKRVFTAALRTLDSQVRGVRLSNEPE
jgi:hypothetical protein